MKISLTRYILGVLAMPVGLVVGLISGILIFLTGLLKSPIEAYKYVVFGKPQTKVRFQFSKLPDGRFRLVGEDGEEHFFKEDEQ